MHWHFNSSQWNELPLSQERTTQFLHFYHFLLLYLAALRCIVVSVLFSYFNYELRHHIVYYWRNTTVQRGISMPQTGVLFSPCVVQINRELGRPSGVLRYSAWAKGLQLFFLYCNNTRCHNVNKTRRFNFQIVVYHFLLQVMKVVPSDLLH